MNSYEQLSEILRLLRNLIRIGTVTEVNLDDGLCRVQTGANVTGWLHWLAPGAGNARVWRAPSAGKQVLILALGGELDTAFVLPGIYSDDNPAPSASADGVYWQFPDGAMIAYEPASGALTANGIKTATIQAATEIRLDTPVVKCTQLLQTVNLSVTGGGRMQGDIEHTGGRLSSNGVVVHNHNHGGVERGSSRTDDPQ